MPSYISPASARAFDEATRKHNAGEHEVQEWERKNRTEKRAGGKAYSAVDYKNNLRFGGRFNRIQIMSGTDFTQAMYDLLQMLTYTALLEKNLQGGILDGTKKYAIREAIVPNVERAFQRTAAIEIWRRKAAEDFCFTAWGNLKNNHNPLDANSEKARKHHNVFPKIEKDKYDKKPNPFLATFHVTHHSNHDISMYLWVRDLCDYNESGATMFLTASYDKLAKIIEDNRDFANGTDITKGHLCFQFEFPNLLSPTHIRNDEGLRRFLVDLTVVSPITRLVNSWTIRLVPSPTE